MDLWHQYALLTRACPLPITEPTRWSPNNSAPPAALDHAAVPSSVAGACTVRLHRTGCSDHAILHLQVRTGEQATSRDCTPAALTGLPAEAWADLRARYRRHRSEHLL